MGDSLDLVHRRPWLEARTSSSPLPTTVGTRTASFLGSCSSLLSTADAAFRLVCQRGLALAGRQMALRDTGKRMALVHRTGWKVALPDSHPFRHRLEALAPPPAPTTGARVTPGPCWPVLRFHSCCPVTTRIRVALLHLSPRIFPPVPHLGFAYKACRPFLRERSSRAFCRRFDLPPHCRVDCVRLYVASSGGQVTVQ